MKIKKSKLTPNQIAHLKLGPRPTNKVGLKGVRKVGARYYTIVPKLPNPFDRARQMSKGGYDNPIDAAKTYDEYMRKKFGDWVFTNFKNGRPRKEVRDVVRKWRKKL